jgi:hypothetical protein
MIANSRSGFHLECWVGVRSSLQNRSLLLRYRISNICDCIDPISGLVTFDLASARIRHGGCAFTRPNL